MARRTVGTAVAVALAALAAPAIVGAVGPGYGSGGGVGGGFNRLMGAGVVGPGPDGGEEAPGGWTWRFGTALSATYTDNANLTDPTKRGQEEIFLQVLPWVTVKGDGARLKARGYYGPALYTGTIGDTQASVANFLDLGATAEVMSDTVFVDGYAKASMANLNAAGSGAGLGYDSYLYDSGNITQVSTWQLSPHTIHHLGRTADLFTRVGVGATVYSDASSNNATNLLLEAGLRSGADFQRMPWSLIYRGTRYDYDDDTSSFGDSTTYEQVVGRTSYVISPNWRADASLGYSSGDYATRQGSETSGVLWSLGGTWTPNPRTLLSLGYGGQYYGNNAYLNFRYSHKRTNWFAAYTTQLTTVQQEFLQSQTFIASDTTGLPVLDPVTGVPLKVTQVTPTLTNQAYVLSSFLTGMNWSGERTRAGFDISWNQRSYEVSNNDQSDWGVGARVARDLSPTLIATARAAWTNYDSGVTGLTPVGGSADNVDRWQAGLLLTKRLGEQTSVSAAYDYRHNLYVTADGYSGDENRVSLIFNHTF